MSLGLTVALVTVNKSVKFEEDSFNSMEVMDKVKVLWTTQTLMHMHATTHTHAHKTPRLRQWLDCFFATDSPTVRYDQ